MINFLILYIFFTGLINLGITYYIVYEMKLKHYQWLAIIIGSFLSGWYRVPIALGMKIIN